jgi:hypothetical protein
MSQEEFNASAAAKAMSDREAQRRKKKLFHACAVLQKASAYLSINSVSCLAT